ncbi:MAG TPA: DUF3579 domain-containing protein [Thiobacillus sp.]|jgi:uncharacterized protein YdiU (UPF0061 family)|nr:DUF3579 domain-containing protein [Thiobacillus sp.]
MSEDNRGLSGMTQSDIEFNPTAWIESLAATLASFLADPRLRYSYGVQPNVVDGELSLIVAPWLETENRATYDHVMSFAKDHQLRIVEDRRTGERALPHSN